MTAVSPPTDLDHLDDGALADRLHDAGTRITTELRKAIVGQEQVIELALTALFAGGNCLLVGVPGLAKTLLIHSMARALDLKFSRIQFTPDLMPSDVTGTDVIQDDPATGQRRLAFMAGPIFANVVLADEINRTPPKTQSALLEAMQERRVTVQGRTYELEPPFFVFATQNPIELEGTYPLPEAQLDRFLFEILLEYSPEDDEVAVVQSTTAAPPEEIQPVVSRAEIIAFQRLVRRVPVADEVVRHAVHLVRADPSGAGCRRLRAQLPRLWRLGARRAGADPRWQGAGAAPGAQPCGLRGRPRAGPPGDAAPAAAELPGAVGTGHHRRPDRPAAGTGPAAAVGALIR